MGTLNNENKVVAIENKNTFKSMLSLVTDILDHIEKKKKDNIN